MWSYLKTMVLNTSEIETANANLLPKQEAIIKCLDHKRTDDPITRENAFVDDVAKRTVLTSSEESSNLLLSICDVPQYTFFLEILLDLQSSHLAVEER